MAESVVGFATIILLITMINLIWHGKVIDVKAGLNVDELEKR